MELLSLFFVLAVTGSSVFIINENYPATSNSTSIKDISLDWNSKNTLPSGTITLDKPINGTIELHIPKSMPRTMNLDFGTHLLVTYPPYQQYTILETESDCFYILSLIAENTDRLEFGSASVATGRWEPIAKKSDTCHNVYRNLLGLELQEKHVNLRGDAVWVFPSSVQRLLERSYLESEIMDSS